MNKKELKNELREPLDKLGCVKDFAKDINYLLCTAADLFKKPDIEYDKEIINSFVRQAREKAFDIVGYVEDVSGDLKYIGGIEDDKQPCEITEDKT